MSDVSTHPQTFEYVRIVVVVDLLLVVSNLLDKHHFDVCLWINLGRQNLSGPQSPGSAEITNAFNTLNVNGVNFSTLSFISGFLLQFLYEVLI